jgi:hypothetical protein
MQSTAYTQTTTTTTSGVFTPEMTSEEFFCDHFRSMGVPDKQIEKFKTQGIATFALCKATGQETLVTLGIPRGLALLAVNFDTESFVATGHGANVPSANAKVVGVEIHRGANVDAGAGGFIGVNNAIITRQTVVKQRSGADSIAHLK